MREREVEEPCAVVPAMHSGIGALPHPPRERVMGVPKSANL